MENKKGFSILKALICVIAVVFIVISLVLNIAFSKHKIPKIFGTYIYIVKDNPLGDNITEDAVLFAKEADGLEITQGDIVLCYPEGSTELQLRSIFKIEKDETTGADKYYTATELAQGTELSISRESIKAMCTGYPESLELGKYITFSIGIKGILLQLILPCVILVIFIIAKIASAGDDDENEEYDFYEYDEEEAENSSKQPVSHEKQSNPLFEPSQEIQPSNEFERKKMSIAENFSQKKVNPNSPYQKEKERTMQFKAQRSAETSFAARNLSSQSSTAPTADALREEMLRKTAEAERTANTYGNQSASAENPIDNTGILSKAQLAEMARNEVPKSAPLRSPVTASTAPKKKSSSPDIDDIIKKSDSNAKKKSVSDMSIDDLLNMIESEKNKL
ncbi:MAG: hypothetical protein E7500_08060 [Ruminococcus sp.]|nr:hypothetical protein [Ruminococcus sp.]